MKFLSISTLEDIEKMVQKALNSSLPFAFDIETTGVNPYRDSIVGVSFCFSPVGTVYIPLGHKYGQPFNPDTAFNILKRLFEYKPSLVFNMIFDSSFLEQFKISLHPESVDVSLLTYTAGTELFNSLAAHAKTFLNMDVWSFKTFMSFLNLPIKGHNISEAPIAQVAEYCGKDALATFCLYEKLYPQLKNNPIYKLENELLPVVREMRKNGVLVDKEYLKNEGKRITEEFTYLERIIYQQASEKIGKNITFNIGSSQQVSEIIYKQLGVKCTKKSQKTGAFSTSQAAFAKIKWTHPIVHNILIWKALQKQLTSYLNKFPALIEKDGRIHASFNQTGVVTGRFSSSQPNLQNIPGFKEWRIQGVKEGSVLSLNSRNMFHVPDKWRWVSFDYSQIEARVAAGVTKEIILLTAFDEEIDFHTKTASLIFQTAIEHVTKDQRQMGKKLNFLLLYGGEYKKLYEELIKDTPITIDEAKRFCDLYYEAYPRMFKEAARIGREAHTTASVNTIFGRRVPIPLIRSEDTFTRMKGERQAYNAVIQGSAADILKQSLVKMYRMIKSKYGLDKVKLILTVHDSQDYEVHPDVPLQEFLKDSFDVLKYSISNFPRLYAEAAIGEKWGSLKEQKKGENINKFIDRVYEKDMILEKNSKVFVLKIPSVQHIKFKINEIKDFLQKKKGNNILIIKIGATEGVIKNSGIDINDKDEILLRTSGEFYEQMSEEGLKNL